MRSNSVFQGLIDQFGARVLEITGITNTDSSYRGGTVNNLSLSTLTLTPFTTLGGGPYTLPSDEGAVTSFVSWSGDIGAAGIAPLVPPAYKVLSTVGCQ